MRIDAHQHFWRIARGDYGWLTPQLAPLYRDFDPSDIEPLLRSCGIDRTILVQAAPTVAETEFMLDIAARTPFVAGVVGWVDFDSPRAPDDITRLAADRHLVGIRPMVQDIADDDWLVRPSHRPVFEALIAHGLVFDALVLPRHLSRLHIVLERHPRLTTVIDHGAKPEIRHGKIEPWHADMTRLAAFPNVTCKLSGLVTEARPQWTIDDLQPYAAHLLAAFGAERLIFGSDWPVCTLATSYEQWHDVANRLLPALTEAERAAVFGGNAARIYLKQSVTKHAQGA